MDVFIGLVISVLLAAICVAVANAKGRNPWLWGILGFLFSVIALIVIAALPSGRPSGQDVDADVAGGVRHCPQCDAETGSGHIYCPRCGARLTPEPEAAGRVVTQARFLTPLVGLIVGLIFALILLQATKMSAETIVGEGASPADVQQVGKILAEMPPVVLFWPVSSGPISFRTRISATSLVWDRIPITVHVMILGGGLAVLMAWGVGLAMGRRHPGITFGRMAVASVAAIPVFWLGLLMILVLAVRWGWLPTSGYDGPFWDGPRFFIMPIFMVGILGGLWAALEMRSRGAASPLLVLARALGVVLRNGGMLLSGIILVEIVFAIPGVGRVLLESVMQRDAPVLGVSAAVIVWMAILSRFLGNLLLAAVEGGTPVRTEVSGGTERGRALAIGAGVTGGLLFLLLLLPLLASQDPQLINLRDRLVGPSADHWLGADVLGRDMFSRVLHGGRTAALIGLPMGLLALTVGFSTVIARVMLDRARAPALMYGIEGVLEGLVAVPWLVIGILIQANWGPGWPFLALAVILVPRALRVGWTMGAGEDLEVMHLAPVALRLGALFLAAALAMSSALGFFGLGLAPGEADLGVMVAEGRQFLIEAPWIVHVPGLAITLVVASWLVVATLFSRSGPEYRPVGWAHTMS